LLAIIIIIICKSKIIFAPIENNYHPSFWFGLKRTERRSGKAKTGEGAEFSPLNEHSESVFNAA
jgi:hypothetical protein